ncbi:hypothetical protein RHSIM_Rhsim05G0171400 [Rhododendron simsii]|uniref:SWIM-type domain-containing protein n=1 Tax=Rhododendron simsii TaxID=118357 RepID=A0A834GZM4_RHOSS|nr:hypothetical protein RHSIM_Rhsim05G0171400 [Rhododendron simsii]
MKNFSFNLGVRRHLFDSAKGAMVLRAGFPQSGDSFDPEKSCFELVFSGDSCDPEAEAFRRFLVQWNGLKSGEVGLSYSLESDRFCMLLNDDDLDVMFELVSSSGLNRVKVSVFDAGLFPICFAIVDAETNVSWSWFLGKLRDILSNERDIVFFSDRNDGICSGIANIFPRSPHSYCLYHLKMNLRHALSGLKGGFKEHLVSLFSLCAHAPNEKMFDDLIADLKRQGKGREERHLPVTQLVDRIRMKMMENIAKRSQVAAKWNFSICPNMNKELENSFHVSKSWNVKRSTTDVFEVLSDPSVMVNLSTQTCSCFEWQFRCFPCCHAVCAIYNSGKNLQNYVDPYYMVETYREVYSLPIYPIPTLLKPAPGGNEDTILPPLSRKPSGRPRKKRLRSNGEKIRPIQCSRCGKVGRHNRKTCKEDLRAAD